jgi:hypothetical protein
VASGSVTTLASRAKSSGVVVERSALTQAATGAWAAALVVGLLWPSHTLSLFDGMPLEGRAEAIVVGLVLPALIWLDKKFLQRRTARALIVVLIAAKAGGSWLVQEGLCARFSTTAPFRGTVLTMPIDEPRGVLRSWDVRADWRADAPVCTAILDRPYRADAEFPAWFVNTIDHVTPGHREVAMAVSGSLQAGEAGAFTLHTGPDMRVRGRIGTVDVASSGGTDIAVPLGPGTHAIALDASLTGERWRFEPEWNGRSAWGGGRLTTAPQGAAGRAAGQFVALATTIVVVLLVGAWSWSATAAVNPGALPFAWSAAATAALVAAALSGRLERASGLLLFGAAFVPVAASKRTMRTVFFMIGVPWLAFLAAKALPLVGHVTAYSWDDWLAYQLAAARIYMHGYWLEGGTKTFDYQALYRWINGALHIVFGDSSVGETYLDAGCLLSGAMLAYALVKPSAGFRVAVLACAGTLATFLLGTPWYFIGRGLSEIAAAGFAFAAAFLLLRSRLGCAWTAVMAGVLAVLAFYARVNHLPFAISLMALLLPLSVACEPRAILNGLRVVRVKAAVVYAMVFAAGVALFAARTWWYTGVFSLLYGTSLKNNDTGLRLSTIASAEPWRKVAHSLSALVWMNEPPRPDPRSLLVVGGVLAAVGAIAQIPRLRQLPAAIVAVAVGSTLSSFLAHTHGYPGRMSLHLIPFAVSAAMIAAVRLIRPVAPPAAR